MPTVAELAAQEYQEVGYALFVEGWPVAFTNRIELAGSGGGSWIGTTYGDRVVALGLEPPPSVKLAVGILDSGMPIDDDLTLSIVDRDGHLIAFAQDEPGTAVLERLAPTDDPAPATLLGFGTADIDVRGRWLNGEMIGGTTIGGQVIGSPGQRRMFQVLPGGALPGYDHASIDSTIQDLRASTVQTAARHLEGRPVALYLIRRDPPSGTWASWGDQHASGYSLIWWGTIKGWSAQSHAWQLQCEGPSSWLRRTLNANRPAEWRPLLPLVEFAPGEDRIAASFTYRTTSGLDQVCGSSLYDPVDDVITSGLTPPELATQIDTRLQTIAGMAGPGGAAFDTTYGGVVKFWDEYVTIKVDDNTGGDPPPAPAVGGILALRMHKKAWLHLGWDLWLQAVSPGNIKTAFEVQGKALGSSFSVPWLASKADPAPGYYEAWFTTCPLGLNWTDSPDQVDGDSATRVYKPVSPGGISMLYPESGQRWDVGFGIDAPYLEGQLARPPADKVLDGLACTTTGFFAVRGSHLGSLDGEVETRHQLAKVSWINDSTNTTVQLDSGTSRAIVWAESWLDPRAFGAQNDILDDAWAANDLMYASIALLGYNLHQPDLAHRVLARLLLSSGTASWTGTEGDPNAACISGARPDCPAGPRPRQHLGSELPLALHRRRLRRPVAPRGTGPVPRSARCSCPRRTTIPRSSAPR